MTPILRLVGAVAALFWAGSTATAQGGRGAALPPATAAQPSVASSVTSPHGPALREACASCHRADGWKPARIAANFKHAERTFPLAGAHERATCMSCHTRLDFQGASTTCASCHSDPHKGEFGVTCARCHNTRSFVDRGSSVRTHQGTRFPLRGAHAIATCEACHTRTASGQMQFAARATTCASCHLNTFRATKSPSHTAASFSTDCTSCHTLSTWTGATFDHNATKFQLTGKHAVATCQGCHADGVYRGRSMTCVSCHQNDYTAAREPRHAQGFPTTCESCHGTAQWKGAKFDHQTQTTFPLTGKHVTATCASCHANGTYTGTQTTCVGCHQAGFDATTKPPHRAARFATTCESCHNTATWTGAPFDHATTRFALTGGHRAVTCTGCHADNVFVGKSMTCVSCHQGKAAATTNPHHAEARFASTCESCHTTTAWAGARFDHAATRFPLTGRHVPATCLACHSDKVYAGKPSTCQSCHQRDYDGTAQPNHSALGFPRTCETCHSTSLWDGAKFDHATTTRFVLTGAHRTLTCRSCHADGVYRGKPMTCIGCHQGTFTNTTAPHHQPAGFSTACESCHTTTQWRGPTYDHSKTRFPLLGRHIAASCLACHNDRVYAGKPSVCTSCHQRDYDAATAPNHRASGFPTTCESCHSNTAWKPATFDHNQTRFQLAGGHRNVSCQSCHADGVYRGKPLNCVSCHQAKFDATTQPNHRTSGYTTTCETCHSVASWKPAALDHSRFPLLGAHRAATCDGCHGDGVYRGKPSTCVSCHQAKFDATTRPNHRTSGIPTTCATCHNENAWTPATFDHAATRFPLVGAHRTATCAACHSDGIYSGKPTTCVSCHQTTFNATTRPNHRTANMPTTCLACHNQVAWSPATFDHAVTRFPLAGAHRAATCADCHADGVYTGRPTTCVSCHQSDFNATTRPNHAAANIPTTCQTCHNVTAWLPGTFDHAVTRFPLAGAHRVATCAACHGDGVYTGKSTTCVSCHQGVYNATTKPPHAANGINTTCQSCHTTTAWLPGTFNHSATRFALTGAHVSQTCLACHGDGVYRGKSMVCLSCHTTDYNATTNPNHRTAQFPTGCESCHTTTRWLGATFNHDGPWFPIYSGKHRGKWNTCTQCHNNSANYREFTCLSCHEHNQSSMDSKHRGRNGYKYESPSCYACHPRGD